MAAPNSRVSTGQPRRLHGPSPYGLTQAPQAAP